MLLNTYEVVLVGGPLDGKTWRISNESDTVLIRREEKTLGSQKKAFYEYHKNREGKYTYMGTK